jgi:hypothetical protein
VRAWFIGMCLWISHVDDFRARGKWRDPAMGDFGVFSVQGVGGDSLVPDGETSFPAKIFHGILGMLEWVGVRVAVMSG